jgi:hypothetical protein
MNDGSELTDARFVSYALDVNARSRLPSRSVSTDDVACSPLRGRKASQGVFIEATIGVA